MAFNPFHSFRKHQKVLLAGITIVAMFSFILCTGGIGDNIFVNWGAKAFGFRRASTFVSIYNRDYDQQQWREIQQDRQAAVAFLKQAQQEVFQKMLQEQRAEGANRPNPDFSKLFEIFNYPLTFEASSWVKDEDQLTVEYLIWQHEADRLGINLSDQDINHELNNITGNKLSKNDLASAVTAVRRASAGRARSQPVTAETIFAGIGKEFRARIAQEALLGQPVRAGGLNPVPAPVTPDDFWKYYQENCTRFTVDLVPFAVADFVDQVKDKPTEAELKKLYDQYKNVEESPELSAPGFKQLRRSAFAWVAGRSEAPEYKEEAKRLTEASLAAQRALSGATLPVAGIAQAASIAFNSSVETELLRDYDSLKYNWKRPRWTRSRDDEFFRSPPLHDTSRDQPVNVASMIGQLAGSNGTPCSLLNGTTSFLANAQQRETEDRLKIGTTWLLNAASGTGMGGGPLPAAEVALWALPETEFAPPSDLREEIMTRRIEDRARRLLMDRFMTVGELVKTEAPAVQAARTIGLLAGPVGPLCVVTNPEPKATVSQLITQYHLKTGKTSDGSLDQPSNVASLVGQLAGSSTTPAPLFDGVVGSLATAQARGMSLRDKFHIAHDPGLASFKEAYVVAEPFGDPANVDRNFASQFFGADEREDGFRPGLYQPQPTSWLNGKIDSFLYWRTEDQPAKVVPYTNPEVRAAVEKAWRFQKARALAVEFAKKQEIAIRETKGDKLKVKDFAFKLNKPVVELPGLAKRIATPSTSPTSQAQHWGGPNIDQSKVARSGDKFAKQIVEFQNQKIGDTMILQDQPERIVYVAILVDRQQNPAQDRVDFYTAYKEGTAAPVQGEKPTLFAEFLEERRKKYAREFVDKLKAEANYKKTEKEGGSAPNAPNAPPIDEEPPFGT